MLGAYLDPSAIAIVVGGTAIGTVLRTPRRDLARALAALRVLFRRRFDATALVAQVASLGRIAQRHGVIALDRSVIRDPDVAVAVAARSEEHTSELQSLMRISYDVFCLNNKNRH